MWACTIQTLDYVAWVVRGMSALTRDGTASGAKRAREILIFLFRQR